MLVSVCNISEAYYALTEKNRPNTQNLPTKYQAVFGRKIKLVIDQSLMLSQYSNEVTTV